MTMRWPFVVLADCPAGWRSLSEVAERVAEAHGRMTVCHVVDTSPRWRYSLGAAYCSPIPDNSDAESAGERVLGLVRSVIPERVPVTTQLLLAPEPEAAQIARALTQSPLCDALILTAWEKSAARHRRAARPLLAAAAHRPILTVSP